jgi:hypothetical protein
MDEATQRVRNLSTASDAMTTTMQPQTVLILKATCRHFDGNESLADVDQVRDAADE